MLSVYWTSLRNFEPELQGVVAAQHARQEVVAQRSTLSVGRTYTAS